MSPEVPTHGIAGVVLRTVTESDYPFLRSLYRSVREAEIAPTGWSDAQKQAFCDSQFELQDRHYREHFPGTAFLVIERGGEPIGRIYIDTAPGPLRLMDIALLPAERGRRLGTAFLGWLCTWADREGRVVTLHVEANNPARRLYQRHEFVDDGEEGPYVRMRRDPR